MTTTRDIMEAMRQAPKAPRPTPTGGVRCWVGRAVSRRRQPFSRSCDRRGISERREVWSKGSKLGQRYPRTQRRPTRPPPLAA